MSQCLARKSICWHFASLFVRSGILYMSIQSQLGDNVVISWGSSSTMTSSSSLALGFDLDCYALRVRWIALRPISLPILSPLAYLHVSSYILMPSPRHSVFPACAVSQSHLFKYNGRLRLFFLWVLNLPFVSVLILPLCKLFYHSMKFRLLALR
jgi:hypothetical protein